MYLIYSFNGTRWKYITTVSSFAAYRSLSRNISNVCAFYKPCKNALDDIHDKRRGYK